jgi:hypothetical protein
MRLQRKPPHDNTLTVTVVSVSAKEKQKHLGDHLDRINFGANVRLKPECGWLIMVPQNLSKDLPQRSTACTWFYTQNTKATSTEITNVQLQTWMQNYK